MTYTLWGPSQHTEKVAPGICWYSTASHGGYHLSPMRNALVHPAWKSSPYGRREGWYEEDLDYNIVYVTFPGLFTREQVQEAHETLKAWYPDEYRLATGAPVSLEESFVLRERLFLQEHARDYLVLSAWGSWHPLIPKGMVGVFATIGGSRDSAVYDAGRYFLVPETEYNAKPRTPKFLVDLNRHKEVERFA